MKAIAFYLAPSAPALYAGMFASVAVIALSFAMHFPGF